MYKKTEEELQRAAIAKITRAAIRVRYSIMAERAINDTLPDLLFEFDKQLQAGNLVELPDGWEKELVDEVTS